MYIYTHIHADVHVCTYVDNIMVLLCVFVSVCQCVCVDGFDYYCAVFLWLVLSLSFEIRLYGMQSHVRVRICIYMHIYVQIYIHMYICI